MFSKIHPSKHSTVNSAIRIFLMGTAAYAFCLLLNVIVYVAMRLIWNPRFERITTDNELISAYTNFLTWLTYFYLATDFLVILLLGYVGYRQKLKWYEVAIAILIYCLLLFLIHRYCFPLVRNQLNGVLPFDGPAIRRLMREY